MDLTVKRENRCCDWGFLIYFILMFCLYTNSIIQLGAQAFILLYVVFKTRFFFNTTFAGRHGRSMGFYIIWFGGLTLLFFLSIHFWAYGIIGDSKTMLSLFRIFAIGLALFIYVDSFELAFSVLISLVYAAFVMGAVAMLTTPISMYGLAGGEEGGFGGAIGQHRNQIGMIAAPLTCICFYFGRIKIIRYGIPLGVFFLILTLCSGSRGAFLQLLIISSLFLFMSTSGDSRRLIINVVLVFTCALLSLLLLSLIPYLHEVIFTRLSDMFQTVLGGEASDLSSFGRDLYKQVAWDMFLQKPLLGFGLDGFTCYLIEHPYIHGYYLEAVYSHCNYAELAADLGLVGLAVWYVPIIVIIVRAWRNRRFGTYSSLLLAIWISMIILDYARIPWETHLSMYFYFVMVLLVFNSQPDSADGATLLSNSNN